MKGTLEESLRKELQRLQRIINITESRMEGMKDVEGKLRITTRKNEIMYYHRLPGDNPNGKYIKKKEEFLAHQLAQKSYDEKVLKLARKRLGQIKSMLNDYRSDEIELVYTEEHPLRQRLIQPVEPTWKQSVEHWMEKEYEGKPFDMNQPWIETNRGERVRSKSEKILADFFDTHNIPYKYECPLFLPPRGIIYPDFTFLSKTTGEEVYWEHLGMMHQPEYAKKAILKIELYQSNGILMGNRLIITFEIGNSTPNTRELLRLADFYGLR